MKCRDGRPRPSRAKRVNSLKPQTAFSSKAKLRTKRHSQIVVSPAVKENVVARLGPNPDWSGKSFESTGGVKSEICRAASKFNRINETSIHILVIDGEVVESDLPRHKHEKQKARIGVRALVTG
jgi:hypothetical protein